MQIVSLTKYNTKTHERAHPLIFLLDSWASDYYVCILCRMM